MLILENILSQEIIQKLGWTLLHFIWQAVVAALLLAILLRVLRKSTANLRYIIVCLALGLIVLLPVITIQLVLVSAPHMEARIVPVPAPTVLPTLEMPATETIVFKEPVQPESVTLVSAVSWKQRAVELLEPDLPYIVSGWLLGVFGLSVWHLGGWAQLQRLKRRMVKQVDDTLHSKLKVLAQKLRVKQTVQLMESALVQIPTVVGWLRPVILLPASALTGLSSEQLEAILAHELAHIRRCDYLINILQTIVEILGFYHPAVWWVSHKIRAERENCCDDLAVSISGDRVCYARALTSMEEIRTGHGQLAVAASGGNLSRRICRLVGKDSEEKTGFSWIPAATAILLIIALAIPTTLALTNKSNPQQVEQKTDRNKPPLTICTGRIINSKGNPLASAKVAAYEEYFDLAGNVKLRLVGESVTKTDGNFLFQTRPSVKKGRSKGGLIVAQKEGLALGWAHWPLYGNQRATITLQEPTKLSGMIVDENGESIPNAEVRAVLFENKTTQEGKVSWLPGIQPFNWLSTRTDRDGQFELNNIPQNVSSDLLVTASGFSTIYTRRPDLMGYEGAEFVAGQTDIKITMPFEARIEGKVVNKRTGAGLPGITLKVIPHFTPVFFDRYLCTTKEDGTFNIGGLRSGKYMIRRVVARTPTVDVVAESGKTARNVILKIPYEVRNKIDKENVRSGKILLKLINPSSQPVVGAWVGTFVDWSDIAESPPVWFLNDGGSYRASKIDSAVKIISNEEGKITLTEEELFKPQWPTERTAPLTAIDEGHYLAGLRELSREDLGTEVTLTLQPGCRVHGRVSAATAHKRKWSTNILTVYVYWHEHRPCQYTSKQGRFEFVLPPGKYKVMVYSEDPDKAVILPILIKPGQRDLDLTEYLDGKRKLSSQTTDMQVEDDRLGESQQGKDSLANNIPTVLPTIVKSPIQSAQDKTIIQVDCLVVEVFADSRMDRETTIVAENILGNKVSLGDSKVDVILRKAAEATAAITKKSAENKRVTQEQFKTFVDMLISKGYLRILMNPRIEVMDGKTAKISSTQKISSMQGSIEDLIQITPHVFEDGYITLQVDATISSKSKPKDIEQIPIVTTREVSTLVRTSPGESLMIIGGLKETEKSTKPNSNVKDSEKQTTELLFILTPTIITPATDSQEKTDVRIEGKSTESAEKLKRLGLAVIMYADDHDKKLPDTLEPLKPYIANEQDYLWLLNNAEYIVKEKKYQPNQPNIPVAYDKTQIDEQSGTDVLFLDGHVEFLTPARLKEFVGVEKRFESAKKLSNLGHALLLYANDNDDKYPDSMHEMRGYLKTEDFEWTLANVEYLAKGKTIAVPPDVLIAYDKKLLTKGKGTNVLFNDSHVDFVKPERLKELGISANKILIETRLLSVSEDFLQSIGLDANSVSSSDAWSEHLLADPATEPNSETYSLILDELHVSFLIKASQANKDTKMLAAPRVTLWDGTKGVLKVSTDIQYISGYIEPNDPSDEPTPKHDFLIKGLEFQVIPNLTPDNKHIALDLDCKFSEQIGSEIRMYKNKYPYEVPRMSAARYKAHLTIPGGRTILMGGQKIIEQAENRSRALLLSKLPIVGGVLKSSNIKDHKMLLLLVKPIINPQQKAEKIQPAQADSEEHIKHLGRLLEKKLNPPAD